MQLVEAEWGREGCFSRVQKTCCPGIRWFACWLVLGARVHVFLRPLQRDKDGYNASRVMSPLFLLESFLFVDSDACTRIVSLFFCDTRTFNVCCQFPIWFTAVCLLSRSRVFIHCVQIFVSNNYIVLDNVLVIRPFLIRQIML
jgi:hypothetical protein